MWPFWKKKHARENLRYFAYVEKGPWKTRGKTALQSFRTNLKISSNRTYFDFSKPRKISAGIRWWTHRTTVGLNGWLDVPIGTKTKCPVHIMMFGLVTSDNDIMSPFIFPNGLRLNMEAYIKYLEEVMLPGSRGWLLEDPMPGNRTHATQAGETSHGCQKISFITSGLTSGFLTPQIANPLDYYMRSAVGWETKKIPCNTKNKLKARITAAFTNLKKKTIRKTYRRFWSCLEVMIKDNSDYSE